MSDRKTFGQTSATTPHERNFRKQMATLRRAQGLSQRVLAKAITAYGVTYHQTTVSKIESGERPLPLGEAYVIAEVLGVPLATMTGDAHAEDALAAIAALSDQVAEHLDSRDTVAASLASATRRVNDLERAIGIAHRALGAVTS